MPELDMVRLEKWIAGVDKTLDVQAELIENLEDRLKGQEEIVRRDRLDYAMANGHGEDVDVI